MKRQKIRKLFLILSFLLFPITQFYFSPYLIITGLSEGIIAGSFMVFSFLFLVGLFFGRIFCGWLMPCGGFQEILFLVKDTPVKPKKLDWIKYVFWLPWLLFIAFLSFRFNSPFTVDPFYHIEGGISISARWAYFIYYGVLLIFLLLSLLVGKRAGCHATCWISPFMITGQKLGQALHFPQLKLTASPDSCISCGQCTKSCPMSLDVMNRVQTNTLKSSECIFCGQCIDICPKNILSFSFGLKNN